MSECKGASGPSFLARVHKETPTRYWVNNPTREELKKAVAADAVACTTNPTFPSKLLQRDAQYMKGVIAKALKEGGDADRVAERAYHLAAKDIMTAFMPRYASSGGREGFVTIQDDPRKDFDAAHTVEAAMRAAKLERNYMAKIPVICGGIEAIEELVARNVPICATEVFAISQAVLIFDAYAKAAKKSGMHPPLFVTHITGIFDQYFADIVKTEKLDIAPALLAQAGTLIGRKEYAIAKERGYEGTLLGGGARGMQHFNNFVGGDMHITINWSTAEELNAANGPVAGLIDAPTPSETVQELSAKLPNFRRAYEEGAMKPEEFADFGPVMLFKTMFLNGYSRLIDEVRIEMMAR